MNKDSGGASLRCRILSHEEMEELLRQTEEEGFCAEELLWRGGPVACEEKDSTVYLPCSLSFFEKEFEKESEEEKEWEMLARWEALFSNLTKADPQEEAALYVAKDERMGDPAAAMREGHAFTALLLSNQKARLFRMVLTGLPALCIEKTDSAGIRAKEMHEGRIRMIDCLSPDGAGSGGAADAEKAAEAAKAGDGKSGESISCLFHVRGNLSSSFSKKPYKITLTDGAGEKKKVSWLGLREDDDWILNPLYTDESRVREKTAYDLWEQTQAFCDHPQASSRIRYVELFMDGACCGLYGLMEPVDHKQLGLSAGDLLYKIDRWNWEYPYSKLYEEKEAAQERVIKTKEGYSCVEIRWPLAWDGTATWKPMAAFHRFCFGTDAKEDVEDFSSGAETGGGTKAWEGPEPWEAGDLRFLERESLSADLDSIVSLSLFCGMTHAVDNKWKNGFLIAKKESGGYSLYRTVWDLNYVFGDVFVFEPEQGYTAFDAQSASLCMPEEDSTCDYEAFLEADPSLEEALSEKWAVWRRGGISAGSVIGMVRENRRLLEESGVLTREAARWPAINKEEGSEGESMTRLEEWIRERFLFLDGYFAFVQ